MSPPDPALLAAAHERLYPNYRQPDLVISHGRGAELWDSDGRRYLDLFAGVAVSALGHAHPRLVAAISEQAGKLLHLSNYFYNETNVRLVQRLTRATGYQRAFFCNSGTEAIEALLKLARRHFHARGEPDRYHVIAFDNSFHGRTLGALAATGQPKYREGFGPLPGVRHVPYGDLDAVRAALTSEVCAVLVEPVQGEGGVLPAPPGFLAGLRELTSERGALLLADEIQTGVGRTGKLLGVEHAGVRPDALALAKGLGGGVPIGAMLCSEALAGALPSGSHGSTFGGSPLASAAALVVLDELEGGLLDAVVARGDQLARGLAALAERHARHVLTSRGLGLMQCLVLRDGVDARGVMERLREAGVLITIAGGQGLRFTPPLVIGAEQIDEGLAVVERVLGDLS